VHPELFEIPFLHITVKSYGTMMVIGFLVAVSLMRRMMKKAGQNPEWITNGALYALMAGVVSSRVFYVLHHSSQFEGNFFRVFAVWEGGLEFLGGVLGAVGFLLVYCWVKKLPYRLYFDVLAVGLMVGAGFGRIGCLLNGCCYGRPADVPWAIRFPYNSLAYQSQVYPDPARGRTEPRLKLPAEYFGWQDRQGGWIAATEANKYNAPLKPFDKLTDAQKRAVTQGDYRCLPVHPTQIYSSINLFAMAAMAYGLRRWLGQRMPGAAMSMTLMVYGVVRFCEEMLRDDNPFEYAWWMLYRGGTISQNISIYLFLVGGVLLFVFAIKPRILEKIYPSR